MTSLREQILQLIAALRTDGVRISVAESIDAANAVAAAGLERIRMREALAAALIKDEADRPVFEAAFARFFAAPALARGRMQHPESPAGALDSAAIGRGRAGDHALAGTKPPEPRTSGRGRPASVRESEEPPRAGSTPREPREKKSDRSKAEPIASDENRAGGEAREPKAGDSEGIEAGREARLRAIERTPFSAYTELEYEQAREALAPLERRFRVRMGRRMRMARAGRVDIRRTIRAAIQRGGVLAELRFRSRRPRHVDLLILADISGSVRYAAELMLELVAGARGCFRRVRSFVYIDRLTEADFEDRHLVTSPALDMYARSDFGRVLGEVWERRAELLGRQTLVVIMGDARNNRRPARADLLREISRSCKAVVWLNPEEPERWGTGDSAINQYAREVAALVPSRNLRELERGLMRIG